VKNDWQPQNLAGGVEDRHRVALGDQRAAGLPVLHGHGVIRRIHMNSDTRTPRDRLRRDHLNVADERRDRVEDRVFATGQARGDERRGAS
jgi:hypothetical protein